MAVLNKIRQRSLFLILIIALALFSFVLADLFRNSDALTARSQNTVATINGKDISREDFLQKVENMQRQMGPNATNTQVMNRVWDAEVRQAVLAVEYDKLGITIEKDQMRDLLKTALSSSPEFLNEAGVFDEGKMNEYIANLKNTSEQAYANWIDYENNVAANALQQNYFNLVKAGLVGTLSEGELEHKLQGNKVDIKFVQMPYSKIADSTIEVSKSDISAYINAHQKEFEVEAATDIKYVEFKEVATVADENAIKAALENFKKGTVEYVNGRTDTIKPFAQVKAHETYINSIADSDIKFEDRFVFKSSLPKVAADTLYNLEEGSVYGPYKDNGFFKMTKVIAVKQLPDSAKVRHILIPYVGSRSAKPEVKQTEAQAKVTADSLLTILKKDSSKFPEFVKQFSSDQGSVEKEGRYDWHPYGTMVPEFNEFEFEGKVGDMAVVKTIFGFHIVEIEGQKEKSKAVKIGTIARKIEPSQQTIDAIFRDASNFEIAAQNKDFEATAKEKNYTVRPVNGIKALDENIPGLGNQRPIVRWAFGEEATIGAIKRFTIPNGYAIAQLVAKHDKGLMSVEDASATVLPKIRKERKAELIKARVSASSSLEDIASAEGTTVRTASAINMKNPTISGAGREPLVVGAAFALNEGETSPLIAGEKGVYKIEVTKVTPAVALENYQSYANQVETKKSSVVNSKLYGALKDAADIEDNRVKLQIQ